MRDLKTNHLIKPSGQNYSENFSEIGKGIFVGRILSNKFCDEVLKRVKQYQHEKTLDQIESANSMHYDAIMVDQIGLKPLVNSFVRLCVDEISSEILPEMLRQPFDNIHSYVVRYSDQLDRELGFHVDNSLLTINLCLNDGFLGSELVFEGERCPSHIDTLCAESERVCIEHKKGFMVLHHGKNRHYVNSIISGERYNLIIWCQNDNENSRWFDALSSHECMEFCAFGD